MSTELIIIFELVAVLVIVLLVSVVLWRDKSSEVGELSEVNQALMTQLEQMQAVLDGKKTNQELVLEKFQALDDELDEQVNATLDSASANLGDMERLVLEHKSVLTELEYFLNESDPDIKNAKLEIQKLKNLLVKTEKEIVGNKKDLSSSEIKVKTLKEKMRDLSKQIITLNTLEASEGRLKRDKTRLMGRMDDLKEKHEIQKVITRNLENELKTSFKAGEVQAMRDDLRRTEETLNRTMIEKAFIEKHFLELVNDANPEEIDREIKRVDREMRQLQEGK
jgi:chromosome segregation ATPase